MTWPSAAGRGGPGPCEPEIPDVVVDEAGGGDERVAVADPAAVGGDRVERSAGRCRASSPAGAPRNCRRGSGDELVEQRLARRPATPASVDHSRNRWMLAGLRRRRATSSSASSAAIPRWIGVELVAELDGRQRLRRAARGRSSRSGGHRRAAIPGSSPARPRSPRPATRAPGRAPPVAVSRSSRMTVTAGSRRRRAVGGRRTSPRRTGAVGRSASVGWCARKR